MAKNWYPVIDYLLCLECGACSSMCMHGVYDLTAAPTPRVSHPDCCIDHCHGCGTRCPAGAITYVGDDTGWVPPAGNREAAKPESCCCADARQEDKHGGSRNI